MAIRIMIVDDHTIVREGLCMFLERHFLQRRCVSTIPTGQSCEHTSPEIER
jgi:DNA-binding NarL/FixJ family response regulator